MIDIAVARCKHCGSVITSRASHDFNSCQCGQLSVDGGVFVEENNTLRFTRVIGSFQREDLSVIKDFPVEYQDLYDDWNKGINEYKDLRKYA
ncbi:hypothetical protein HOT95_gp044 [Vibrio phage vB_VpS_PG07]|uniref:DUF7695 domain-containing protein n=1 Tax=Vibrio phage vB_VpS_PG07 TaxID=2301664 RepID=A0A385E7I3_9CAUD|nr:hypothetical protein HOT95_gp044 [Vibrio phage vB_VpS_PG07]AXQ66669.1 hypothetical protein [Vibrio phage vB_VpS_PG07]